MKFTWLFAPFLFFFAVTAAACTDDDQDGADGDDGVVLGTTPEGPLDAEPGVDSLGDDLNEVVRRHLEVDFGDRDWVDDVQDIEHDGDKVRVQLDRNFEADRQDFDELCTAVVGQLADTDVWDIEEVTVTDEDGREVMRSRPDQPQCESVAP